MKQLLEIKLEGIENMSLPEVDGGSLDNLIKEYFIKIAEAYDKSKIPEETRTRRH